MQWISLSQPSRRGVASSPGTSPWASSFRRLRRVRKARSDTLWLETRDQRMNFHGKIGATTWPNPTTVADAAEPSRLPPSYTVLARRYRPQQFGDLVGQEAGRPGARQRPDQRPGRACLPLHRRARRRQDQHGAHSRQGAQLRERADDHALRRVRHCRAIAAGEDIDVLEIDGASNRGIDEVREIRQNVQYRPSRARYKIYIIDEVHMLTTPAFNALLKTLEEPPPHVKFIFATTEVQKIPVTILSRCQRFDFGGIGMPRIVERLREIVAAEGMQADDDALELIARRAGGSMRDAQSLLDQLLAFGDDRLTAGTRPPACSARPTRSASPRLAAAVLQQDARRRPAAARRRRRARVSSSANCSISSSNTGAI